MNDRTAELEIENKKIQTVASETENKKIGPILEDVKKFRPKTEFGTDVDLQGKFLSDIVLHSCVIGRPNDARMQQIHGDLDFLTMLGRSNDARMQHGG